MSKCAKKGRKNVNSGAAAQAISTSASKTNRPRPSDPSPKPMSARDKNVDSDCALQATSKRENNVNSDTPLQESDNNVTGTTTYLTPQAMAACGIDLNIGATPEGILGYVIMLEPQNNPYPTTSTCANDPTNNRIIVNTLEEFKTALRQHEVETFTKYVYSSGDKAFNPEEKFTPKHTMQIRWEGEFPYYHIGARMYICHQGKDGNTYQKKKFAQFRDNRMNTENIITKRYNLKQPTKKVDCPAKISVSRRFYLPRCKLTLNGTKSIQYQKDKYSKMIKSILSNGQEVIGQEKIRFRIPDVTEHQNHDVGVAAAVTEQMDPIVRDKIKEFVREGKRSITLIMELVEEFVSKEIGETNRLRRRFYPNRDQIRSVVLSAKKELGWSKIDLEKTYKMLTSWDEANLFFRPSSIDTTPVADEDYGSQKRKKTPIPKNPLLFVYQTYDMKRLFGKYGPNAVLLDAAYKICKCALPLYFLVVKTNVDYQVVAVVITQFETMDSLVEGLTVIRDWNPDVTPRYGVADLVADEIKALETVYEGIQVFVSSFHREQAWTSWSSKKQQSCLPKDELLARLRRVANSSSEEDMQVAVEELRSWEWFKTTPLKAYFDKTWMPEVKRWAFAYKPNDLLFDINTSDGVECMENEELKYRDLQELQNCSLSELVEAVGNKLPGRYKSYVQRNVHMMTKHRKYTEDIPEFLHNRPKWFINHVMRTISAVEENALGSVSSSNNDLNAFYVSSEYKLYVVNFDLQRQVCSCTCEDFCRTHLLCKHCIMVGVKFPEWRIDKLSVWMFNNPIFTYDEDIITINEVDYDKVVITVNEDFSYEEEDIDRPTLDGSEDFTYDEDVITINDEENEDSSAADVLAQLEMPEEEQENSLHVGSKKQLVIQCNNTISSLQSLIGLLPESNLMVVKSQLDTLFKDVSSQVTIETQTSGPTGKLLTSPQGNNRKRK